MLHRIRTLLQPIDGTAKPVADDATILLCEFRGTIRDGSAGNPQVEQVARTTMDALGAANFRSMILDFSGVRYTFGNHVSDLLVDLGRRDLDLILVVSERCRQLGAFAERIGWRVCNSRSEALAKLRPPPTAGGNA